MRKQKLFGAAVELAGIVSRLYVPSVSEFSLFSSAFYFGRRRCVRKINKSDRSKREVMQLMVGLP